MFFLYRMWFQKGAFISPSTTYKELTSICQAPAMCQAL